MEYADEIEIFRLACITKQKFGVYFHINSVDIPDDYFELLLKSAQWMEKGVDDFEQAIMDGHGVIFLDSKEVVDEIFDNTYGDDSDPESERWREATINIYLLSCSPQGVLLNENT